MGRPSNWNSPTTSVRLPIHALPAVLALAKQLDDPKPVGDVKNNVQNPTGPYLLTSECQGNTYRLFLNPPRDLSPLMEHAIGEYCDQVLDELSERDRLLLLARLVEEMGVQVDD
ncbi:MAG: hypothetical protein WBG38_05210 [Nodosilinea sp.]